MATPFPPGTSRRRPTVSERRRRQDHGQTSNTPALTPAQIAEDEEAQIAEDEEPVEYEVLEHSEMLTGPFPGGPEDISILTSFPTHIAACIWKKEEREPLKCLYHGLKLCEWMWNAKKSNQKFQRYVRESGLHILLEISYRKANRLLVSAFVERWQPETNTFHMPFREMTITLDDVGTLVGIPVLGRSLTTPKFKLVDSIEMMVKLLGVSPKVAETQLNQIRGQSVGLEWLRLKFSNVTDDDSEERIKCAARAYLLYLVGCTIFSDKSGNRVSISYLGLFEDLANVSSFAWGAAVLAYIYRQLGYASRSGVRQIAGYLPLVETWIYEHFPSLGPIHNQSYTMDLPRACLWTSRGPAGTSLEHLQALREKLDSLKAEDVIWNPYRDCRDRHQLLEIAFFTGCIKCFDIIEPYHPERVLRQFGRIQIIPPSPIPPFKVRRGYTSNAYSVIYTCVDHMWDRWRSHVLSQEERSVEVIYPWDAHQDYLDWYRRISHPIIQPPTARSAVFSDCTRGTDVDASLLAQRITNAIRISDPTIRRGSMGEFTVPELYQTIQSMRHALDGSQSSTTAISDIVTQQESQTQPPPQPTANVLVESSGIGPSQTPNPTANEDAPRHVVRSKLARASHKRKL